MLQTFAVRLSLSKPDAESSDKTVTEGLVPNAGERDVGTVLDKHFAGAEWTQLAALTIFCLLHGLVSVTVLWSCFGAAMVWTASSGHSMMPFPMQACF